MAAKPSPTLKNKNENDDPALVLPLIGCRYRRVVGGRVAGWQGGVDEIGPGWA